jgi:lipid-A-disaccharide synthase
VRNIYYICPQFWAWRPWRVRVVRRRFAQALCIFPFEEAFFGSAGVPTKFIGHPLVGAVQATQSREEFCRVQNFDPGQPIVAILPGSRHAELAQHMPVIREACQRIHGQRPAQFVLAAAAHSNLNDLQTGWNAALNVRVVENQTYNASQPRSKPRSSMSPWSSSIG